MATFYHPELVSGSAFIFADSEIEQLTVRPKFGMCRNLTVA